MSGWPPRKASVRVGGAQRGRLVAEGGGLPPLSSRRRFGEGLPLALLPQLPLPLSLLPLLPLPLRS